MATNSDRGASTNGCGEAGAQSDELHKAAFHGDLERLTELLRDGANTSAQDKHGGLEVKVGGHCVLVHRNASAWFLINAHSSLWARVPLVCLLW